MTQTEVRYHAVLVGIDAYRTRPLRGCVNDIDAVQRLLIERAGVPAASIRRLASPHPGAPHDASIAGAGAGAGTVASEPATLANIRAALGALPEQVREGDRVFIYYSGHGMRAPVAREDGGVLHRESIVPVDVDATAEHRLLCDHELNQLLGAIAARTPAVTCILDCCHSAGLTRDPGLRGATARCLDPVRDLGWTAPSADPAPTATRGNDAAATRGNDAAATRGNDATATRARLTGLARSVGDCHVVAACLNHEQALETISDDGVRHGLLTRALLEALGAIPDRELLAVPWSRVWQAVRASIEGRHPWQHPWMAGNPARAVLGGLPVAGDPGLPIRAAGEVYEIAAGTLASLTEGAEVAVYDEQPPHFPALGSAEDRAARLGLLRVAHAGPSSATAAAVGEPFELPPGARGRIALAGKAARLRCALRPHDEEIAGQLRASPLLEVTEAAQAQVWLERVGDRWLLTDDVHDHEPARALVVMARADLVHAREVLEHYSRYALPLRMTTAVQDLPGALELSVLACERRLPHQAAQEVSLPEAPAVGPARYDLRSGSQICFRVRNTSAERLWVTLMNSAASGRVQILGNQVIDARCMYVFWSGNDLGKSFTMNLPPRQQQGIDRMVAIGTTEMGRDLGYLRVNRKFSDILAIPRSGLQDTEKDVGDDSDERNSPPIEQWTATQVVIRTTAL